jgi:tetratricopeptide (TPR) repeat protein
MKKVFLSLALVAVATVAFGQKKAVQSAEKNFKKGDLEIALTEVEGATQNPETKDDPTTHLLKAKIQTKMFEKTEEFSDQTVEIGRNALSSFQNTMKMVGNDKNSKVGKEVYKEDLPDLPENLKPFSIRTLKNSAYAKAIATYENDDYANSFLFFALAADIDPADTTATFNAAFLANDLGKTAEAKDYFTRLLSVKEYDKLNAYYFLIQIASAEENNPEEAYRLIQLAREDYPSDKTLQEYEIQLLLQMNKMEEAMGSIEEALKNDPNNPGILLRYGYLKEQSGDLEGALTEYKKSVEADPNFFEGNFYTGAIYLDRAKAVLAEINELSDAEWEKRAAGMGKQADKIYEDAIPYFTKASELKPDNTDILEILHQIYTRLKNAPKVEEMNQKLIKLLGENWMER